MDETDQYVDNLRLQRVNAALLTSRLPKHLRKCAPGQPGHYIAVRLVKPLMCSYLLHLCLRNGYSSMLMHACTAAEAAVQ